MKQLTVNKTLTAPLLTQSLKGLVIKVSITAAILVTMFGIQLAQAQDSNERRSSDSNNLSGSGNFIQRCAEGEILTWYEEPIYDEQGLFVVDWKKVRVCVPEDLTPEG